FAQLPEGEFQRADPLRQKLLDDKLIRPAGLIHFDRPGGNHLETVVQFESHPCGGVSPDHRRDLCRVVLESEINVARPCWFVVVRHFPLDPDQREISLDGVLDLPRQLRDCKNRWLGHAGYDNKTFFRYKIARAASPARSSPCVRLTVTQPE